MLQKLARKKSSCHHSVLNRCPSSPLTHKESSQDLSLRPPEQENGNPVSGALGWSPWGPAHLRSDASAAVCS